MGKEKSLIIVFQKYQIVKITTVFGYLVMSVNLLLLMGIVTKGKLSTILTKLSTSIKTIE
jgi:hypothetical protein